MALVTPPPLGIIIIFIFFGPVFSGNSIMCLFGDLWFICRVFCSNLWLWPPPSVCRYKSLICSDGVSWCLLCAVAICWPEWCLWRSGPLVVVVVVWLVGDLKVLKTTTLIASEAGYNRYRAATIAVLLLGLDGLAVAKEMVVSSCGGSVVLVVVVICHSHCIWGRSAMKSGSTAAPWIRGAGSDPLGLITTLSSGAGWGCSILVFNLGWRQK